MEESYAFISYSRRDAEFVDRLSTDLHNAGIRVWRDVEQIKPGQQWPHTIEDALKKSLVLIYVSSVNSSESSWMFKELMGFSETNKLIIPVIVDDAGENFLPKQLKAIQWIDFRLSYNTALKQLLSVFPTKIKTDEIITTPIKKLKGYVFISYAEEDLDFVEQLRNFLTEREYGYWDYAESDRNYHTQFVNELEEVIIDAEATLSVLSEAWKVSKWTIKEYFFSEDVQTPVFLLRAKKMRPSLASAGLPYIDFVNNADQGFIELDRELQRKEL